MLTTIAQTSTWGEWLGQVVAVRAVGALAILALAWLLGMYARRAVDAALTRAKFDVTLAHFFAHLARWAILVAAVLIAMAIFGIEATSFAAIIAAMGLAVGLALQGTLGNFAAGIMLLAFRPFKVGDVVEVSGELGVVQEIELVFTQVDTFDNRRVLLPNSTVFGSKITNLSHHPVRRADFNVSTAYAADLDQARDVILKALESVEGRDTQNEPAVLLMEMGESSMNWSARIWAPASDLWPTRDRAIRAVKYALDEAGISIPFPQRDLHIVSNEANEAQTQPASAR